MVVAHPGVADLAVLPAPVGVVEVASHEVIYLLCGGVLGASLDRGAEYGEAEPVKVVPVLLGAEPIGYGPVIYSLNPVVAAESG